MWKYIKSNWRDFVLVLVVLSLLIGALLSLGSDKVAESGWLSQVMSVAANLLGGILKTAVAFALAWFGLAVTLPEANRFIVGTEFDKWWLDMQPWRKAQISLIAVAVLALVAGLCMGS